MPDTVERLLVTTPNDGHFTDWWMVGAGKLNIIETRNDTTMLTLWNDPPILGLLVDAAKRIGVTLQVIEGAGDNESYVLLHGQEGIAPWKVNADA